VIVATRCARSSSTGLRAGGKIGDLRFRLGACFVEIERPYAAEGVADDFPAVSCSAFDDV
jgi:hypothetical protein